MPTSNFFSEGGYARNPVVRDKTAAELLATLESRMEVHLKKPGSIEFAQIFDEVARRVGAAPCGLRDSRRLPGDRIWL